MELNTAASGRYDPDSAGQSNSFYENLDIDRKRLIAQRLHTDFLLEGEYITSSDLTDGLYYDEYSQSSTYFAVSDGTKVAACRCISPMGNSEGVEWLPTIRHFEVHSGGSGECEVGITAVPQDKIIEVSALIAAPLGESEAGRTEGADATHLLCSAVLRHSLDEGHKLWIINIEERLRRSLNIFLGATNQVQKIGEPTFYYRPDAIPCIVQPEEAVRSMLLGKSAMREYRLECLRAEMSGVSEQYLSSETIDLLHDVGIATSPVHGDFEHSPRQKAPIGEMATKYSVLP